MLNFTYFKIIFNRWILHNVGCIWVVLHCIPDSKAPQYTKNSNLQLVIFSPILKYQHVYYLLYNKEIRINFSLFECTWYFVLLDTLIRKVLNFPHFISKRRKKNKELKKKKPKHPLFSLSKFKEKYISSFSQQGLLNPCDVPANTLTTEEQNRKGPFLPSGNRYFSWGRYTINI